MASIFFDQEVTEFSIWAFSGPGDDLLEAPMYIREYVIKTEPRRRRGETWVVLWRVLRASIVTERRRFAVAADARGGKMQRFNNSNRKIVHLLVAEMMSQVRCGPRIASTITSGEAAGAEPNSFFRHKKFFPH